MCQYRCENVQEEQEKKNRENTRKQRSMPGRIRRQSSRDQDDENVFCGDGLPHNR